MAIGGTLGQILGAGLLGAQTAAGIAGNTAAARTGSSSSTANGASTNRTRRVLRPEQEGMVGTLTDRANTLLTNPSAALQPIRSARRSAVNETYAGIEDGLAEKLLTHGQRSGKFGTAMRQANQARLGALSGVDSDISQMILDQQNQGQSLMERLLSMNFESESNGSQTSSDARTFTDPGSALAGGLASGGSGLSSLMSLMALNKLLRG